jgi:hypothetical protein
MLTTEVNTYYMQLTWIQWAVTITSDCQQKVQKLTLRSLWLLASKRFFWLLEGHKAEVQKLRGS